MLNINTLLTKDRMKPPTDNDSLLVYNTMNNAEHNPGWRCKSFKPGEVA